MDQPSTAVLHRTCEWLDRQLSDATHNDLCVAFQQGIVPKDSGLSWILLVVSLVLFNNKTFL